MSRKPEDTRPETAASKAQSMTLDEVERVLAATPVAKAALTEFCRANGLDYEKAIRFRMAMHLLGIEP